MTKDQQIQQLTLERDALIEELDAYRLLLCRQKSRLGEVKSLRETVKSLRRKIADLSSPDSN